MVCGALLDLAEASAFSSTNSILYNNCVWVKIRLYCADRLKQATWYALLDLGGGNEGE